MTTPLPPGYRDCSRLLMHIEKAVRRFSCHHKDTVDTDLRQAATQIMRAVNLAVNDKAQQCKHVQPLVWLCDDYKLTLKLAAGIALSRKHPRREVPPWQQVGVLSGCANSPCTTDH